MSGIDLVARCTTESCRMSFRLSIWEEKMLWRIKSSKTTVFSKYTAVKTKENTI